MEAAREVLRRYWGYDDFRPGQWEDDQNIWTDNNCTGAPNSPPSYF